MLYQPKKNNNNRIRISVRNFPLLFFFIKEVFFLFHQFSSLFQFKLIIQLHPNCWRLETITTPMSICNIFNLKSVFLSFCYCLFGYTSTSEAIISCCLSARKRARVCMWMCIFVQRVCSLWHFLCVLYCIVYIISLTDLNDGIKTSVLE